MFFFNAIEIVTSCVCTVLLFFLFHHMLKCKKKAAIATALIIPALLINIHGATQYLQVDSSRYINAFSNMQNAIALNYRPSWGVSQNLVQYRTTQLFLGPLFDLLRGLGFAVDNTVNIVGVQDRLLFQLYTLASWSIKAMMLTAILFVIWKWYIPEHVKAKKYVGPIMLGCIGITLFALPLNAFLSKASNYDGMSTYPAVLAVLLAGACILRGDKRAAIAAAVFALLGAIEKTQQMPYLPLVLVMIIFGMLLHSEHLSLGKRLARAFVMYSGIFLLLLLISTLNLVYIFQHARIDVLEELNLRLTPELVIRPFTFIYQIVFYGGLSETTLNMKYPYLELVSTYLLLFALAVVVYGMYSLILRKNMSEKLLMCISKVLPIIIVLVVIMAIAGAYFLTPLNRAVAFGIVGPEESGYYMPQGRIGGIIFAVTTKSANLAATVIWHYVTVIAYVPTVVPLMMLLLAVMLWRRGVQRENALPALMLLLFLLLPAVYALGGQPAAVRYYSAVTDLILINTVILLAGIIKWEFAAPRAKHAVAAVVAASMMFFFFEIGQFSPNTSVAAFSPSWLIVPREVRLLPRYGYSGPGSPSLNGDNNLLAVGTINRYYRQQGMPDKEYDYRSDYGRGPLGSRNARIIGGTALTEAHFTEDTWFSFNRFQVYRSPTPAYLIEVEPFFRISYRGVTAVWVYRGDQLVDYMDYFGVEPSS